MKEQQFAKAAMRSNTHFTLRSIDNIANRAAHIFKYSTDLALEDAAQQILSGFNWVHDCPPLVPGAEVQALNPEEMGNLYNLKSSQTFQIVINKVVTLAKKILDDDQ